jgi:hypothetical protein
VFISYSWDSDEHKKQVFNFANFLRQNSIHSILDVDLHGIAPSEGWPRWMEKNIEEADHVVLICTKQYLEKAKREVPLINGKGVAFETVLIYADSYVNKCDCNKYIPMYLQSDGLEYIPTAFQAHTSPFTFDDQDSWKELANGINDNKKHLDDVKEQVQFVIDFLNDQNYKFQDFQERLNDPLQYDKPLEQVVTDLFYDQPALLACIIRENYQYTTSQPIQNWIEQQPNVSCAKQSKQENRVIVVIDENEKEDYYDVTIRTFENNHFIKASEMVLEQIKIYESFKKRLEKIITGLAYDPTHYFCLDIFLPKKLLLENINRWNRLKEDYRFNIHNLERAKFYEVLDRKSDIQMRSHHLKHTVYLHHFAHLRYP